MEPVETILVDAGTVACDGDAEPSGHPRVFLNIGDADHVDCPYCGRRYVLDPDTAAGARF